jgi:N utilization substance protein B
VSDNQETSVGPVKKPSLIEGRRRARRMLVQALYQWQIAACPISQIEAEFRVDNDMSKVDTDYFSELLRAITARAGELDKLIAPALQREIKGIDPIELSIIRLGAYEMQDRLDIPYRVVINEGVELVKRFGGTDGHRFVNSVLDRLAIVLRQAEIGHRGDRRR